MTRSLAATLDAYCLLDEIRDWRSLHDLHAAGADDQLLNVMQEWHNFLNITTKDAAREFYC